jgi:CheY-like chemotaxis protein
MNSILIVDDCIDDTADLRKSLVSIGIINPIFIVPCCSEAMSYLEGLSRYSDRTQFPLPAVIFLDLKFPGMDGFEFLKWIRDRHEFRKILVVAVSGYADLHSVRRAYEGGANSFVTKPCGVTDLKNLVQGFSGPWKYRK